MNLLTALDPNATKKAPDHFDVGDLVDVHTWITEGDKRRIQVFTGLVIRINHGRGVSGSFTVRRIVAGEGVERVFPFHSPNVDKVEVTRYGKPRRARLYYLRQRVGKDALKVKELVSGRRRSRAEKASAEEAAAWSSSE